MSRSVPTKGGALPDEMRRTRTGRSWILLVAGAILLALLLIFVVQNLKIVNVHFLLITFPAPLGVALLMAAICGALLTAIPFSARIFQLRRATRKRR